MAVYDNLKKYFDRTIKPYNPYKSNNTFQSIGALLKDTFFKDSYDTIPASLSLLVNDQKISLDIYNKLLIGNGYPEELVKRFSTDDKEIILENLMHYQNESGTLDHFREICTDFGENFNVYELYADYRLQYKDGKYILNWVLVGNPIYSINNEQCEVYDYQEVYNKTPTLFLSKNQLEYWRRNKSIVLPFKTNMIVISEQDVTDYSMLDMIIGMTAYSQFQNDKISIEKNNNYYTITLGTLFQMWQYFTLYGDKTATETNAVYRGIMFPIESNPPYVLDHDNPKSISNLIREYDNITDYDSRQKFLNSISSNYTTYLAGSNNILEDLRSNLISNVSIELIKYYEDLIDGAVSRVNGVYQVLSSLDGILNSYIHNAANPLVIEYEKWFKLLLKRPNSSSINSTTYRLLYEFKPYHTRFILESKFKINFKDKSENVFAKDRVYFVNHNWPASAVVLSDSFSIYKNYLGKYYLTNNGMYITQSCMDFHGIEPGNIITFVQLANPDIEYTKLQVIDIEKEQVKVTKDQYDTLFGLYVADKPKFHEMIEQLEPSIVDKHDDQVIQMIRDLNESHEILFAYMKDYIYNKGPVNIYFSDSTNTGNYFAFDLNKYLTPCSDVTKTEFAKIDNQQIETYTISDFQIIYDKISKINIDILDIKDQIEKLITFEEVQSDGTILTKQLDSIRVLDIYNIIINSSLQQSYKNILSIPFLIDESLFDVVDDVLYIKVDDYKDVTKTLYFDIFTFSECINNILTILSIISSSYPTPNSLIEKDYLDSVLDDLLNQVDISIIDMVKKYMNSIFGSGLDVTEYNIDNFTEFNLTKIFIESQPRHIYNENQIAFTYRMLANDILLTSEELKKIERVITADDICTLIFDRPWDGPTGWYDQLKVTELPPVEDIVQPEGAQYTFTNIELAQYVHCNDIAFTSVYIGDYIYMLEDDVKHAVKVIGKDLDLRNLKIDKSYTGTAGTFERIGRYRTGF